MKWLARAALVLGGLAALVLLALAIVLPRVAGSAAVRARIEAAAREAIGREVRFESLEAGFLPPALRVIGPRVAGPAEDAPALLSAKSVELRLALLPLLTRTLAIDSLVVEAPSLHLTRTRAGLDLPKPGTAGSGAPADPEATTAGAGDDASAAAGLSLALRSVSLRDGTLVLDDRAVSPPVRLELRDLRVDARGRLLGQTIDLKASAALAGGGSLRLEGSSSLEGVLELESELSKVELAPLAPYVAGVESLAGALSGELRVEGRAGDPERVAAVLDFESLRLRRGALRIDGPLRVEADLATPLRAPAGTFRADAARAELAYAESFHKPAGVEAQLEGRLVPAEGGALGIEDLGVRLRDLRVRGRVARLSPLELELHSHEIELGGLEALFPGLAATTPTGRVKVESLAYQAKPASLRGRAQLERVELHPAGRPALALDGELVAQGQSVRLEGGRLTRDGQQLGVDAVLEDLFGAPRYRVGLEASRADANQMVSAFVGKKDTLFGLLGLNATLAGPLGGDLLQSVEGRAGFAVDEGRIAGVSLLRSVFDQLGSVGALAEGLGRSFGGRDLQRFYGDEFEALRGSFDVRGGQARTDDLTFAYRGYQVVLRGTMALADLALDTEGELSLDAEIDAQIAKQLGIQNHTPVARSIPLAAVTGTLAAPKVRISQRTAAHLTAIYAAPLYADPLRKKAEEALGPDGGKMVDQGLELLDGLLGGGGRRQKRAPDAAPPPAPDAPAPAQEAEAPSAPQPAASAPEAAPELPAAPPAEQPAAAAPVEAAPAPAPEAPPPAQ